MRKRSLSAEEQQEIEKSIEIADLSKPKMQNGLDMSLFTQKELELMEQLQIMHNNFFRERATKLRFYADLLNDKEKRATLRCMNFEELRPYYQILAVQEKNRRLQSMLTRDKVGLRRYCRMTKEFSSDSSDSGLPKISVAENTENYFKIMNEKSEKIYEEKYYFLSEKNKKQIIEVYSKSIDNSKSENVECSDLPTVNSTWRIVHE